MNFTSSLNKNIKQNFFIEISCLLLCLLPAALIAGPLIAELFLIIINLTFLYLIIKNKDFKYFKSYLVLLFAIFYFYIVTTSFFAEDVKLSLKNTFFYFRFILFALATWYFLSIKQNLKKIFFNFLTITLLIVTIDGFIQFFFGTNTIGYESFNTQRISGFFGKGELVLGSFLQKILPIYFSLILYFKFINEKIHRSYFILLFLIIVLIFATGERSAFFLTIFFLLIFFILSKKLKILGISCFLSILVGVLILFFYNPLVYKRVVTDTLDQFMGKHPILLKSEIVDGKNVDTYIVKKEGRTLPHLPTLHILTRGGETEDIVDLNKLPKTFYIFSSMHQNHIKSAFSIFKENMLFGHGVKMYRVMCSKPQHYINRESCSTHPHNTYFQLLAETGLVGFLLVFSIFLVISYELIKIFLNKLILRKENKIENYQLSLLICFFITLWPIVPTGNFFNNWVNLLYFFPLGFYLHNKFEKK